MIHLLRRTVNPAAFGTAAQDYIACIIREIEDLRIYPRLNSYRDLVLLALLDTIVMSGRAVLNLADEGFADTAFGLSRTSVEAFFYLKYIENKDSEARAKRYIEYFGKDREKMTELITKHHPHLSNARSPDCDQLMQMAKQFKSPHKWYEEPSLKEVAYEKSTWAKDVIGQPQDWEYAYDIIYKFTSHEVHVTSVALESRIAEFLENSRYPSAFKFSNPAPSSSGDDARFNACLYCQAAIEHVFHAFELEVPPAVRTQFNKWQDLIGLNHPSEPPDSDV